jgi:DNA-binding response OmpR family regulator
MKGNPVLSASDPGAPPLQAQSNPPHQILVVEDDLLIQRLIATTLTHAGYEVDTADDGADAWTALSDGGYDLMITDNAMPRMTGVELMKKLRAARMELPVIMATGVIPQAEFARHPWLTPEATMVKPYTAEEMVRTVKKVLREADTTADSSRRFAYQVLQDNKLAQAEERAGPARQWPADSSQRILIADQNSDLRRLYAEALARPGCQVDAATDGAAAWEALQATHYDLLITENDMPSLSGIELVGKLRAAHMSLPVVMAAARLPTDELARNPSLQFAAMLSKPLVVAVLLDTVEQVLHAAEPARETPVPPDSQTQPAGDRFEL